MEVDILYTIIFTKVNTGDCKKKKRKNLSNFKGQYIYKGSKANSDQWVECKRQKEI